MEFSLQIANRLTDDARQTSVAIGAASDVSPGADEASLSGLAGRLSDPSVRLFNLGRREEALAASQEVVATYRRLAETRRDVFLPDLAQSLGAQGQTLVQAERHADAAGAFGEGLAVIAPFVERHVQTFGSLADFLRQEYIAACEKVGIAPDAALLERVGRALGGSVNVDSESKQIVKHNNQ